MRSCTLFRSSPRSLKTALKTSVGRTMFCGYSVRHLSKIWSLVSPSLRNSHIRAWSVHNVCIVQH